MKVLLPEHFVALIKQHANLTSLSESERVIREIVSGLDATLPFDQHKLFFAYTPRYIQPKKQVFYHRVGSHKTTQFDYYVLLQRIMIQENLTDQSEAEARLRAFLTAIRIVLSPRSYHNLYTILPLSLKSLIKD